MNKISWIIFSAVVVLVLGALVIWARLSNPPLDIGDVQNNSVIAASSQNGNIADHTAGSTDNKIIFIEYGDFQCPSCGGAFPGVKTLIEDYGSSVTFIFRNLPLTSIHPNAKAAAGVAEAAGLQNKYWEMHDLLYSKQNDWSSLDTTQRTDIFNRYATSLGLDLDKFNADLSGSAVNQKISFDQALFKSLGVDQATPTFFLNGTQLDTAAASAIVQGDLTDIRAKLDALVK